MKAFKFELAKISYMNKAALAAEITARGLPSSKLQSAAEMRVALQESEIDKAKVFLPGASLQDHLLGLSKCANETLDKVENLSNALLDAREAKREAVEALGADSASKKSIEDLLKLADEEEKAAAAVAEAKEGELIAEEILDYLPVAKACGNCAETGKRALTCAQCDAVACLTCVAEAVRASCKPESTVCGAGCFSCGSAFHKVRIISALSRRHKAAADLLVESSGREKLLELRVNLTTKRRQRLTLGEQLISAVTDPLTCYGCDTQVVLGKRCMHMDCTQCHLSMCGFCLKPLAACDSWTCPLNPNAGTSNDSRNKAKSEMVLRAANVAALLDGVSEAERTTALAAASAAFSLNATEHVGRLDPTEPWLFCEAASQVEASGRQELRYLTAKLRNHLHAAFRGARGVDRPPVVYGSVLCGDTVTLVDDEAMVDYNFSQGSRPAVMAGKKFVVLAVEAEEVTIEVNFGTAAVSMCVLAWAAVVATESANSVFAGTQAPVDLAPKVGDYVLVTTDEAAVRSDDDWHPQKAAFMGKWSRVYLAMPSSNSFALRANFESFIFKQESVAGVLREADAVRKLGCTS